MLKALAASRRLVSGFMAALKCSTFPSPMVPVVARVKCSWNDVANGIITFFLLLRMLLVGDVVTVVRMLLVGDVGTVVFVQ